MIFGFNTDIKHNDMVYHVQSEAREGTLLLQTQVFVRGRCIGKRATSYAERASDASFNDQQKEQILRDQHRLVLDSIREGHLDDVIEQQAPVAAAPPAASVAEPVTEVPPEPETGEMPALREFDVRWVNSDSVHADRTLVMRLQVTENGTGLEGATVTIRFSRTDAAPFYAQRFTDPGGNVEMRIEMDESLLVDSAVLVQASYNGRTTTRKFQLRKVEA